MPAHRKKPFPTEKVPLRHCRGGRLYEYEIFQSCVGADAHIGPPETYEFAEG